MIHMVYDSHLYYSGLGVLDESTFLSSFRGRFISTLRWEHLDRLWEVLREDASGGWYVYAVGEEPPESHADDGQVRLFIEEVDRLLRQEHDEDYCGIVYADNLETPSFIKIYDPNNLGMVCGSSKTPPLPGWVLSKIKPIDLKAAMPTPGNRRRWWKRLF